MPGEIRPERLPDLDGVLVVRKPIGPTSHDVVALVRRLASTRRVGHGGTLDPFASGVLPLFLGHATRVVEYHMGDGKEYRATVCFGASSTTDDLEGELTPHEGVAPSRDRVEAGLAAFRGQVVQVPPAYSAVKVAGRRAYALARAGKAPELAPRTISISRIDLVDWDGSDAARPVAIVEVACSAGTYVRAIARDLGAALGSAAYLGALERTASGPFGIDAAVALDDLRAIGRDAIARLLLPVDAGLEALSVVEVDAAGLEAVRRGQRLPDTAARADGSGVRAGGADEADAAVRMVAADQVVDGDADGAGQSDGLVRLRAAGHGLVAIARRSGGWILPVKVLVEPPAADTSRRRDGRRGPHGDA
jgi:tRNA pseudouridine55 synthase